MKTMNDEIFNFIILVIFVNDKLIVEKNQFNVNRFKNEQKIAL